MGTSRAVTAAAGATAGLATGVWHQLHAYFQVHRERIQETLTEFGLSFGDMRALLVLDADHPQPMRALADSWACDASNATWMVDRLEQRGLVERRAMPADRRVKAVVLTPQGADTKVRLLERIHQPPPELVALDPADLKALQAILGKLSAP